MEDDITSWGGTPSGADLSSVFGKIRAVEARSLAGPVLAVRVESGSELIREGEAVGTFFENGSASPYRSPYRRRATVGSRN